MQENIERTNFNNTFTLVAMGVFFIMSLYLAWLIVRPRIEPTTNVMPSQVKTNNFENNQLGYKFNYPSTWKELKKGDKELSSGLTGGIKRSMPIAIAGVRVMKIKDKGNPESFLDDLDKGMKKSFNDFKKVDQKIVNISGIQAFRYIYTFKSSNKISIKQMQQIVLKDGKVYYFVFHSGAQGFDRIKGEIEQIANSFALTN